MTQSKLIIFTISILLNIIAIGYFTHKIISRYENEKNTETNWLHLSRESLFEVLRTPKETYKIIFLGASIIQYCEWNELLDQPYILNRGIAGDTTHDILTRLQDVIDRKPNQLFIMVGLNDIMEGKPPLSIANNLTNILEQYLHELPTSSVHIISILPISQQCKNSSQINGLIKETNELYQRVTKLHNVNYINLTKALRDKNGFLNKSYTIDGIHLTGQGYQIIKDNLLPYVKDPEAGDTPKDSQ